MNDTDRILSDIRTYLRTAAAAAAKPIAIRTLDSQEKIMVYDRMDGKTSFAKIEIATKIPARTVGNWADLFVEAGLASPPNEYYQSHKALFTSKELGIDVTELKKRAKKSQAEPAPTTLDKAIEPTSVEGEKTV